MIKAQRDDIAKHGAVVFANTERSKFHHTASDWIQSGLALCGRGLRFPVYTARAPDVGTELCKGCRAKHTA